MCATSIGSTFSHTPLPGVRKSGMPDGTDTPAPVSTTAERACRRSSATRRAPLWLLATGNWLRPPEPRLALAQERPYALTRILRSKHLAERLCLDLQSLAQLALVRHLLDLLDRERG